MQSILATSDGPSSNAIATWGLSNYQAVDNLSLQDGDSVSCLAGVGYFQVLFSAAYGPGIAQVSVRYKTAGTTPPNVYVYEGALLKDTEVLPLSTGAFSTYNYNTPALVGGSSLKVTFQNTVSDGASVCSYLEAVTQVTKFDGVVTSCNAFSEQDWLAGQNCTRTGYRCPAHDLSYVDGAPISIRFGHPPRQPRTFQ